jgi:translation initiation factor 5
VLCPKCKLPELILSIKKSLVWGTCNACGAKNQLDNTHKLAIHIGKNPPKNLSETGAKTGPITEDKKGATTKGKKKNDVVTKTLIFNLIIIFSCS